MDALARAGLAYLMGRRDGARFQLSEELEEDVELFHSYWGGRAVEALGPPPAEPAHLQTLQERYEAVTYDGASLFPGAPGWRSWFWQGRIDEYLCRRSITSEELAELLTEISRPSEIAPC